MDEGELRRGGLVVCRIAEWRHCEEGCHRECLRSGFCYFTVGFFVSCCF